MDWDRAIERNSEALNRIVEALFAMLGLMALPRWGGFRSPSTAPCCASSGPPNLLCGASSSSRRAALW